MRSYFVKISLKIIITFILVAIISTSCRDSEANESERIKKVLDETERTRDSLIDSYMHPAKPIRAVDFFKAQKYDNSTILIKLNEFDQYIFTINSYTNDISGIMQGVAEFYYWGDLLSQALSCRDYDLINYALKLKPKLVKLQIKYYPQLRNYFTEILNKNLWEEDMEVRIGRDEKDKTIYFIHQSFYTNKNIKNFHETCSGQLEDLRFLKAKYVTSKYDEYEDIKTLKIERTYSDSLVLTLRP